MSHCLSTKRLSPTAGLEAFAERAYFGCVEIDEKVDLNLVPRPLTTAIMGEGNAGGDQTIFYPCIGT